MKQKSNLWSMLSVMMVAMLSIGFAACGSDDNDDEGGSSVTISEANLIGTWETVLSESYVIYNGQRYSAAELEMDGENDRAQFKADHTYCTHYWNSRSQNWVVDQKDNGMWSLSGSIITIKYDKDGDVHTIPITEFSASRMVIKQNEKDEEGGVIYIYQVLKKID